MLSRVGVFRRLLIASVLLAPALAAVAQSPASATALTSIKGYACGYSTTVGLFGGPQAKLGCDPQVGTASAPAGDATHSPSVDLTAPPRDANGSAALVTVTDPDGASGVYGPASIFAGKWPIGVATAPPSGPITVSTKGTLSGTTAVTSTADIKKYATPKPARCDGDPAGTTNCTVPGGFGPGPLEGDTLHAQCSASPTSETGSVAVTGGDVWTSTDSGGEPLTTVPIPASPPVNWTVSGVLTNVGDVFTVVFNQQIVNADGSLTVNGYHMYLYGPVAIGESIGAQVICGTTPSKLTASDTVSPTCGKPVVEPVSQDDPTPKSPRTELVGVFDAGTGAAPSGIQSITNVQVTNGTVQVGQPSGLPYQQFVPGQTGPLQVTATRTAAAESANLPMTWSFDATDAAGHTSHCTGVPAVITTGGAFRQLPPTRILDTRNTGALSAGSSLDLQVTGAGGVPASGVSAVVGNLTVVGPTAAGWMTVWPTGSAQPDASNVNFAAGRTTPNLVEVPVGTGGKVSIAYGTGGPAGTAHVLFDVSGYVTTPGAAGGAGLYNPVTPARIFDTRSSGPSLSVGSDRTVQITGAGGVPATGVSAVTLNVTLTNVAVAGDGYLTVYPTAAGGAPNASNLNFVNGQETANRVVVPVSADGKVNLSLGGPSGTTVDAIVDVGGWFTDASSAAGGSRYTGVVPNRIFDTRGGSPVGANGTVSVQVAGVAGVPAMGAAVPPTAVVLNLTATQTTARSWLTMWPSGQSQPGVSDVNWGGAGETRANLVVVKVGPDGKVNINNAMGTAHVLVDVQGWYG